MDILYYSNYCKNSKKVLQSLAKTNLKEKISFICIDNRNIDPKTNQTMIMLENGRMVIMPPNLVYVPSLLLVKDKYRILIGDQIIEHLRPAIIQSGTVQTNGEPMCYDFNQTSSGIMSESFTFYDMSPDELSAKGNSDRRSMHNYVSARTDKLTINTPPDTYSPNKIGDVSIENLQQQRQSELGGQNAPPVPDFTY
jgi:hypothetical protein